MSEAMHMPTLEPSPAALRTIRLLGHLSLGSLLLLMIALALVKPDPYRGAWALIPVHFVSGRAGNAAYGLHHDFSPFFIFYQSCILDFILMFYAYPLFVAGYHRASRLPWIWNLLRETRRHALHHKGRIAPYGAVGLMLFVLIPIWSTGPLVGVVAGYLIGLSVRTTFASVMVGNILAVGGWIWAYDLIHDYNRELALTIALVIVGAVLIGALATRIRRAIRRAAHKPDPEDADG